MKLSNVILFAIVILCAYAFIRPGVSNKTPSVVTFSSLSKKAPQPSEAHSLQKLQKAVESEKFVHHHSDQEEKRQQVEPQATISFDDLDRDTREDIELMASRHQIERQYLVKYAGVTNEQFEKIQEQRQKVYQELQKAEAWAKAHGHDLDTVKKPILEKHIRWMQSSIGVGHYDRLQEALTKSIEY